MDDWGDFATASAEIPTNDTSWADFGDMTAPTAASVDNVKESTTTGANETANVADTSNDDEEHENDNVKPHVVDGEVAMEASDASEAAATNAMTAVGEELAVSDEVDFETPEVEKIIEVSDDTVGGEEDKVSQDGGDSGANVIVAPPANRVDEAATVEANAERSSVFGVSSEAKSEDERDDHVSDAEETTRSAAPPSDDSTVMDGSMAPSDDAQVESETDRELLSGELVAGEEHIQVEKAGEESGERAASDVPEDREEAEVEPGESLSFDADFASANDAIDENQASDKHDEFSFDTDFVSATDAIARDTRADANDDGVTFDSSATAIEASAANANNGDGGGGGDDDDFADFGSFEAAKPAPTNREATNSEASSAASLTAPVASTTASTVSASALKELLQSRARLLTGDDADEARGNADGDFDERVRSALNSDVAFGPMRCTSCDTALYAFASVCLYCGHDTPSAITSLNKHDLAASERATLRSLHIDEAILSAGNDGEKRVRKQSDADAFAAFGDLLQPSNASAAPSSVSSSIPISSPLPTTSSLAAESATRANIASSLDALDDLFGLGTPSAATSTAFASTGAQRSSTGAAPSSNKPSSIDLLSMTLADMGLGGGGGATADAGKSAVDDATSASAVGKIPLPAKTNRTDSPPAVASSPDNASILSLFNTPATATGTTAQTTAAPASPFGAFGASETSTAVTATTLAPSTNAFGDFDSTTPIDTSFATFEEQAVAATPTKEEETKNVQPSTPSFDVDIDLPDMSFMT